MQEGGAGSGNAVVQLSLDGFEGPLDLLLDLARRQAVDLSRLSIIDLVDQYLAAIADLGRVGLQRATDWLVMAAWLTWLKSRLLLPRDSAEAEQAEQAAAALAARLAQAERVRAVVATLEAQLQLGRDAWERSGRSEPVGAEIAAPELVSLFRACLAALRRPPQPAGADVYRPKLPPLWRVPDALARMRKLLGELAGSGNETPGHRALQHFLPEVTREPPRYDVRCRAAVASTLLAGLELAREGEATLEQDGTWKTIGVRPVHAGVPRAAAAGPSQPASDAG